MKVYLRLLLILMVALGAARLAVAAEEGESSEKSVFSVEEVLALSSQALTTPAFAEDELPSNLEALARLSWPLHDAWSEAGSVWSNGGSKELRFSTLRARDEFFDLGSPETAAVRLLAFYVEVDRYVKVTAHLKTAHRARLRVDGIDEVQKKGTDKDDEEDGPGEATGDLHLSPGKHRMVIEALHDPTTAAEWTLAVEFEHEPAASIDSDLSLRHRMGVGDLLDGESVRWISLSGDGAILAVGMRLPQPSSDDSRSWIDFYDTATGRVLRSLEGQGNLSSFEWEPKKKSHRYAFVSRDDDKAALWVNSFEGGRSTVVLEDQEDFGSFSWMHDGAGFVFSRSEEGAKDPDNFKRYRGLTDRWAGHRSRSYLYRVGIEGGAVQRLTAGDLSTSLEDLGRRGKRLLFTRSIEDDSQWPFNRDELYELDLETLSTEKICEVAWGLSAQYTNDDDRLLIVANPSAFDGIGENVPEGITPNLYDGQAYLFDRKSGQATAISREFDPSIGRTVVSASQDRIYARVTDRSFDSIYTYDIDRGQWKELPTELESVSRFSLSFDGSTLVYQGTSSSVPSRIYSLSLRGRSRSELLSIQGAAQIETVDYGEVSDYDVVVSTGEIKGRVYYPPYFDAKKKYPAIVYYYGGTVPVTRSYGGRYPKELWASHGYVVYVPQPSGAIGFGQEFSSRHVNNWGVTVADEIIDASKQFLADHEFVDPERVGCIGASYGGFMTMLLTTRTDMFAGAISHAGISALSSYWGEGDWGYTYSAAATAKSYPWNAPQFYVEQSPLFAADKVTTPILLLHGGIDNNVPPGESEQFYTALRVLGKEVEYVRITGERHWILQYDKRKLWSQSIMAWFDRTLKGDAAWWDHLYSVE
jgi:dipeptidyl aminopeptidase/acylaminoacyl peptidase